MENVLILVYNFSVTQVFMEDYELSITLLSTKLI